MRNIIESLYAVPLRHAVINFSLFSAKLCIFYELNKIKRIFGIIS